MHTYTERERTLRAIQQGYNQNETVLSARLLALWRLTTTVVVRPVSSRLFDTKYNKYDTQEQQ